MIKSMDFEVAPHSDFLPKMGSTVRSNSIRIFYDDEWVGTRNVIMYFSGGNGYNPRTSTNTFVNAVLSKGYVLVDTMRDTSNIQVGFHYVFTATSQYSGELDVSAFVDGLFSHAATEPTLTALINSGSKVSLAGQSYGAVTLLRYAHCLGNGSGQMESNHDSNIVGIVANSPQGSKQDGGTSGYPSYDRMLRSAYMLPAHVNTPVILTLGAGDTTHLIREIAVRAYNTDVLKNPLVDIRIIGDERYGHGWGSKSFGSDEFIDICAEKFA